MANVFVSFIHEEDEYAEAVQAFITQILGVQAKPFLSSDQMQVYAGEKWLERIMDELKSAKVVLLMLSDESVKRAWGKLRSRNRLDEGNYHDTDLLRGSE